MAGLQLAPDDAGCLLPFAHCLLEAEGLPPGLGPVEDALQLRPARVPALHPGLGVGPPQQGVRRRQQQLQGRRGEGQGRPLDYRLLVSQGYKGSVVNALSQFPSPLACRSEAVGERIDLHGRHVAQGVQPEPAQFRSECCGKGQQVHRLGRQEAGRVRGDLGSSQGLAGAGGDVGRKLGVSHADAGRQVLGNGVQQSRYQAGLAAVQCFQPVQSHICDTKFRPLHPVADSLQGREHPVELPPVGGLVRFQYDPVGLAGQRFLNGHTRCHPGSGGKVVDDQGPALGPAGYQDGLVLQVWPLSHLHLGPQVGAQDAGDFHAASLAGVSDGSGNGNRPRPVSTMLRAVPGLRVR